MDKLEETKTKHANDDAIVDDTAGQAYVEQFGLETFQRAERAVQADKVTKQTADTFLAGATFLELVNIWAPPDAETMSKIRYAKWNAVRIVKAFKEGTDPNESNPRPDPAGEQTGAPDLDPNDPEVQQFSGSSHSQYPPAPTVQEVPDHDEDASRLAPQFNMNRSLHPSAQSPPKDDSYEVSPIDSPQDVAGRYRNNSVGGGYFPDVPTDVRPVTPPSAPTDIPTHLPPAPSPSTTTAGSPQVPTNFSSQSAHAPPPLPVFDTPAVPTVAAPVAAGLPSDYGHTAGITGQSARSGYGEFVPNDVAISKAQKHARWAISALNFEDSDTAIRELRAALQTLGGH